MLGFNGQVYKKILKLQEQNSEKDKLLAMIAHDLRAPLNAISYVLDQSIEQLGKQSPLIMLLQNGKNYKDLLMALINDLIDYGQIKQGVWKIRQNYFDLQVILDQLQVMFKMQTEAKGISFEVLNSVGNLEIFSDEQRIKQVLTNLLSNAVKFTMQGFVKIKVKKPKLQENTLLFKVVDSGVGIQAGTIKKLGEKAYETHNQQGLNAGGIGLGLFICKKIIQQLGPNESFKVRSTPNKKTQFSFEIYYKKAEKEKAVQLCKIFTEKGEMVRLNSAPIVSGTFQFNKQKQSNLWDNFNLNKESVIDEGLETIAENFFATKECVNDEIDDLRKELLGRSEIEEQKEEEEEDQEPDFLLQNFNWANVGQKKARSLSDEVKLMNDNIKDDEELLSNYNNNNNLILNTANQLILPQNYADLFKNNENSQSINEFSMSSSQEIQQIKMKPPYYFKEKNIQSKDIGKKQRSPKIPQSKQLTSINLMRIQSQPIQIPQIQLINILIADDDPFNLLILSQYLQKLKNYRVTIHKAYHGGQAVDIFTELNQEVKIENLNFIILDCQMPIMDGYNASLLIKEKIEKENYINAVVIGYTAEVGDEVEKKLKSVNMDGYIIKPATEKQFLDYILAYLN